MAREEEGKSWILTHNMAATLADTRMRLGSDSKGGIFGPKRRMGRVLVGLFWIHMVFFNMIHSYQGTDTILLGCGLGGRCIQCEGLLKAGYWMVFLLASKMAK